MFDCFNNLMGYGGLFCLEHNNCLCDGVLDKLYTGCFHQGAVDACGEGLDPSLLFRAAMRRGTVCPIHDCHSPLPHGSTCQNALHNAIWWQPTSVPSGGWDIPATRLINQVIVQEKRSNNSPGLV